MKKVYDMYILEYNLLFDLFLIINGLPDLECYRVYLANETATDLRKYGYEKTLMDDLGYPKRKKGKKK